MKSVGDRPRPRAGRTAIRERPPRERRARRGAFAHAARVRVPPIAEQQKREEARRDQGTEARHGETRNLFRPVDRVPSRRNGNGRERELRGQGLDGRPVEEHPPIGPETAKHEEESRVRRFHPRQQSLRPVLDHLHGSRSGGALPARAGLDDHRSLSDARKRGHGFDGPRLLAPPGHEPHVGKGARQDVPELQVVAREVTVAGGRRLVAKSDAPLERETSEERRRIDGAGREERKPAQALEAGEVSDVEVGIQDRAPVPEHRRLVDPEAPARIHVGVVVPRITHPDPVLSIHGFTEGAELPSWIRAPQIAGEGGRGEHLGLRQGGRDLPVREHRHDRQDRERGGERAPGLSGKHFDREDAHQPQQPRLGEGFGQDTARRLRVPRVGARDPHGETTGRVREERRAGREDGHPGGDDHRPARASKPAPKPVEREGGEDRDSEREQDRELLRVSKREQRRHLLPGRGQKAEGHREKESQHEESPSEPRAGGLELPADDHGDRGERPRIEGAEDPHRLAPEDRPAPDVGVRQCPRPSEGIGHDELEEPERVDREECGIPEQDPRHRPVRLRYPQGRREDLGKRDEARQDRRERENHDLVPPAGPLDLEQDPEDRGKQRHPDRKNVPGEQQQGQQDGKDEELASARRPSAGDRPRDQREAAPSPAGCAGRRPPPRRRPKKRRSSRRARRPRARLRRRASEEDHPDTRPRASAGSDRRASPTETRRSRAAPGRDRAPRRSGSAGGVGLPRPPASRSEALRARRRRGSSSPSGGCRRADPAPRSFAGGTKDPRRRRRRGARRGEPEPRARAPKPVVRWKESRRGDRFRESRSNDVGLKVRETRTRS